MLAQIDIAELRVAVVIVGIDFEFFVKFGDGEREIDLAHAENVRSSERIVRAGSFWIFGNGFFEFKDGLLGIAILRVGAAETHANRGGIAECGEHLSENFHSVLFILRSEVGASESVTVVEIRIEGDGVFELDARRGEIFRFEQGTAEDAVSFCVFRIGVHDGLGELARFLQIVRGESGFGVFELKRKIGREKRDGGVEKLGGFREVAGF